MPHSLPGRFKYGLILLALPIFSLAAVKLPPPDGPYPVGRKGFVWTDDTRIEDAAIPDRGPRHVIVFAFYPAAARTGKVAAYYPGLTNLDDASSVGLKAQFFGSWPDVRDGNVETAFIEDAPIAAARKPFPLLLFSPGLGVPVLAYSIQLAALASHGYVIFAMDHPYDTAFVSLPNGKRIVFAKRDTPKGPPSAAVFRIDAERESIWTNDTRFVVQQIRTLNVQGALFEHKLDASNIGLFGHSMGGRVSRAGMPGHTGGQGLSE